MDLREEARLHLEKMAAHTDCCGTPLIRKMLGYIELHAGDCLSLDNEVRLFREQRDEAEAETKRLRDGLEDVVHTLEAMDMHVDNDLYDRTRAILEPTP